MRGLINDRVSAVSRDVWFKCPRCKNSFKATPRLFKVQLGRRMIRYREEVGIDFTDMCPRCAIVLVRTLESSEDNEVGGNLNSEIMDDIDPLQHEPWEQMVEKEEEIVIQTFRVNGRLMTCSEFEQEVKEVIQGFRVTAPLLDELIESLPSLGSEIQYLYEVARGRSHIAARLTWKQWYLFRIAGIYF